MGAEPGQGVLAWQSEEGGRLLSASLCFPVGRWALFFGFFPHQPPATLSLGDRGQRGQRTARASWGRTGVTGKGEGRTKYIKEHIKDVSVSGPRVGGWFPFPTWEVNTIPNFISCLNF